MADGQTVDGVVLTLAPAGVITGRVLDDFGEIVPGVTVLPMRYRTVQGDRRLMEMTGRPATSDDTGTFRLYGLAPGTYYLSARPEDMMHMGPVSRKRPSRDSPPRSTPAPRSKRRPSRLRSSPGRKWSPTSRSSRRV